MGMVSHFLYQLGELRKSSIHIEAVQELMYNSVGVLYTFITQREYRKQFVDIDLSLYCTISYARQLNITPKPRRPGVSCMTSALACTNCKHDVQENAAIGLVVLQSAEILGLITCFAIHFL